ncbi:unnamed protein product, partial [Pylaiella littoralis]
DTFLIGEAIRKYPELNQVCSSLIPEGVQREYDGTGAGAGAKGASERRAAAKREGDRLRGLNRAGKKRIKKEDQAKGLAETTQQAVKAAVAGMAPLPSSMAPAP